MDRFCILQVDDDENDILLLKFACQEANLGVPVIAVKSGEEALAYLQRTPPYADPEKYPVPSLVLLDLKMPRMNGFEILRWIRAHPRLHGMVVIILTSSTYPDDVETACALHANAFVQKPATSSELVAFVRSLEAFWFHFNELPVQFEEAATEGVTKPVLKP